MESTLARYYGATATSQNLAPLPHPKWESSGTLYTNYDKDHDVFYISKGSTAPEYAEDDPKFDYLWLRKNDENDAPQGVTIFGLRDVPPQDKESLFREIAFFLGVSKGDIELRANAIR